MTTASTRGASLWIGPIPRRPGSAVPRRLRSPRTITCATASSRRAYVNRGPISISTRKATNSWRGWCIGTSTGASRLSPCTRCTLRRGAAACGGTSSRLRRPRTAPSDCGSRARMRRIACIAGWRARQSMGRATSGSAIRSVARPTLPGSASPLACPVIPSACSRCTRPYSRQAKPRRRTRCGGRTTVRPRSIPATTAPSGTWATTSRRVRPPTPRGSAHSDYANESSMKNLLQTQSIAWAQGVRVALEAEGIRAVILDEHDRGAMGVLGRVRLAVLNDDDVAKAKVIVARLTPPPTGPPPSWRWQKRGLILLALDVALFVAWVTLLEGSQAEGARKPGLLIYGLAGVVVILFIGGVSLIILGPRADKR